MEEAQIVLSSDPIWFNEGANESELSCSNWTVVCSILEPPGSIIVHNILKVI